jgi:hypothetical protein
MTELIPKARSITMCRHSMLLCLAVLVAVSLALGCKQKAAPQPTVKMQSTSPNGKYRCVVTEQLPPEGFYSPHLYTFTIRHAVTDRDLKGESYQRDTDSVQSTLSLSLSV